MCNFSRFVSVEKIKDQLLESNKQTYWVPDYVKVWIFCLSLLLKFIYNTSLNLVFLFSQLLVCRKNVFIIGLRMLEIGLLAEVDFGGLLYQYGLVRTVRKKSLLIQLMNLKDVRALRSVINFYVLCYIWLFAVCGIMTE